MDPYDKSGGVKVDGARELRAALKKAGIDLTDEIKDAHADVADVVFARARQLVPVAPVSMTSAVPGLLKDTLRTSGTKTAAIVRAGKKKVPYAGPIHWGWFKRNIKPSLFLSRAAAETEQAWINVYNKFIDDVVIYQVMQKVKNNEY